MTNMVRMNNGQAAFVERVVTAGDLRDLTPEERVAYYTETCRSVGLNPITRPFEYIVLNEKLTLYARKDATDQLRQIHGVSITDLIERERDGVYIVTAKAMTQDGRTDVATGAVPLVKENGQWAEGRSGKRYFKPDGTVTPLTGDALANAIMKAETKAKRRVTLSICGLGWLDETEINSIPSARPVRVNIETGEIIEANPAIEPEPTSPPRKPEVTPEQAAAYFWQRFETPLGGREWALVQQLTGLDTHEPVTVEGWRHAWKATEDALAQEAAKQEV